MARRNKGAKFLKRDKDSRGSWTEVLRDNAKWEAYYKAQNLIPDLEWETFKTHCQQDLPLTFRVTGSKAHAEEVNQKFIDDHVSKLKDAQFEGKELAPKNIAFYPNKLGWQIDVPKSVIRKNAQFAKTQRFLVLETTVGNISRQEAVSMIPPLLMDVQPHHAVLDMCAAPGSKTAQLVESLHFKDPSPLGFVVANDSDYKRLHMLVHQVKRLNLPNFLVVNHDAQLFPRIKPEGSVSHILFDRILCDVPCSGDGTMRKNINVWKDFSVGDGMGLHPLQINILTRGLQLLKEGGRLVYSTCSMNPVENEAVVAEALRKFKNIRVADMSGELEGLIRRPGVSSWKIIDRELREQSEPGEKIHATAFPPSPEEAEKFHLDRCMRVYPHLQNTGGFFITVFEKEASPKKEEPDAKRQKIEVPEQAKVEAIPQSKQKTPRTANEEPFIFLDPSNEQLQKCWEFYDIGANFPKNTCLVRNATGEACRTIYYVSPSILRILNSVPQKLKLIHAGIKIFSAQRNDSGPCPWRAQNEALHVLQSHLGNARKASTNLEMLKLLFQDAFPRLEKIGGSGLDAEFVEKLQTLSEGCLFINVSRENAEDLLLPLWKGRANVNLMVNKHDTQELLMRLYDIETLALDEGKEKVYQENIEKKREQSLTAEPESEKEGSSEDKNGEQL